jgi:hypothetical protein
MYDALELVAKHDAQAAGRTDSRYQSPALPQMQTTIELLYEPGASLDRRRSDRRTDLAMFKIVSRALSMRRVFGADTALVLLCRMNIELSRAHDILAIRVERRLRRRRFTQ